MSPYEAALDLADQAIPTMPCSSTKSPLIPTAAGGRGFADATLDHTPAMWARAALVGMPCGVISGIDAIDIDPRHGGDQWLLENAHRIPRTFCVCTFSGGLHIYLKARPDLRCSVSRIAQGVDVRSNGGYVVRWDYAGYKSGIFNPSDVFNPIAAQ